MLPFKKQIFRIFEYVAKLHQRHPLLSCQFVFVGCIHACK